MDRKYYRLAAVLAFVLPLPAIIVGVALAVLSDSEDRRHFGRVIVKWGIVGLVVLTVVWRVVRHFIA